MRREYYLHKRKNGIYYVEFIDKVSGTKLSAISTGESEKLKAEVKAELWKVAGIPIGKTKTPRPIEEAAGIESIIKTIGKADLTPDDALRIVQKLKSMGLIDTVAVKNSGLGAIPFVQFLKSFWDYDKSEYIQDKLTHGHRFHKSHARECMYRVNSILTPFFGDKKLNCITTQDLKKLTSQLAEKGLATSTINQITLCARTPLKWAYEQKIIPENPCIGLTEFSVTNRVRGILTEAEAEAVFKVTWTDKRAFVASLVAATTGARRGECIALRKNDIGEDTLNISHSYSFFDGLKCPKNGHKRIVPLLPEVKIALLDLLNENPHTIDKTNIIDNPFVFYSLQPDKPCSSDILWKGLKKAIETVNTKYRLRAKISNLEKPEIQINYKERYISFHSWRHWFCSKITQKIDGEKVAKVSGHLSEAVFKKYADHIETKNIKEVSTAAAELFGKILEFRKAS